MKRWGSLILFALAISGVPAIAHGRDLPWRTFSEANQALSGMSIGICPQGPVYLSFHRAGASVYTFAQGESSSRPILVLYDPDPDGPNPPTEYGIGNTFQSGDEIPPLQWGQMPLNFSGCSLLYPTLIPIQI